MYDISFLNTTTIQKRKLRRLKWLRLFEIEVNYSVRIVFESVCVDGENKTRMIELAMAEYGVLWTVIMLSRCEENCEMNGTIRPQEKFVHNRI